MYVAWGKLAESALASASASHLVIHLIRLGENHAPFRRLAGDHAFAFFRRTIKGNAADRRFGFGGDLIFGFARTVPVSPEEPPRFLDLLLELVVGVHFKTVGVAKLLGAIEQRRLHRFEQLDDALG